MTGTDDKTAAMTANPSPGQRPPLRILARDRDDLAILSAMLQDAIVPLKDLTFRKFENRFIGVFNRFRWEVVSDAETDDSGEPVYERTLSALSIDGATAVQTSGLEQSDVERFHAVLTLTADGDTGDSEQAIVLSLAGGGSIRILCQSLRCSLTDLGEPWPTKFLPRHGDMDPAASADPAGK